jgi:hypothetical protein
LSLQGLYNMGQEALVAPEWAPAKKSVWQGIAKQSQAQGRF